MHGLLKFLLGLDIYITPIHIAVAKQMSSGDGGESVGGKYQIPMQGR